MAKKIGRFEQLLSRLEKAYQQGTNLSFDVYPYLSSWSILYTYLPKWSYEGGRSALAKRLNQPFLKNKILNSLIEQNSDFSKITIATATSSPHLVGRSLSEVAHAQNVSVEEAILNLLSSNESEIVVFDRNLSPEVQKALIKHPLSIIATDGAGFDLETARMQKNLVHPRCFGTMPRFLSGVIRSNLMPLQEAVFKISGHPAKTLGIPRRGLIKKRAYADIVVFEKKALADLASLENPFQAPKGVKWVIVNGLPAVTLGKIVKNRSGKILTC